jgi:predicted nucleotidyltransferase
MNQREAFVDFDEELKLDPTERTAAQRLHNEITELLIRAGVIVFTFLQGSFARKTMLAPLRDIDKIVIMAGQLGDQPDMQARPELAMDRIQAVLERAYRTRVSLALGTPSRSTSVPINSPSTLFRLSRRLPTMMMC